VFVTTDTGPETAGAAICDVRYPALHLRTPPRRMPRILMADRPAAPALIMQVAASRFLAKPLYVAGYLGIADLLESGPQTVEELASRTETHAALTTGAARLMLGILEACVVERGGTYACCDTDSLAKQVYRSLLWDWCWEQDPSCVCPGQDCR
jgi:hypothetical protein